MGRREWWGCCWSGRRWSRAPKGLGVARLGLTHPRTPSHNANASTASRGRLPAATNRLLVVCLCCSWTIIPKARAAVLLQKQGKSAAFTGHTRRLHVPSSPWAEWLCGVCVVEGWVVSLGRVIARGLDRMEGREEGARWLVPLFPQPPTPVECVAIPNHAHRRRQRRYHRSNTLKHSITSKCACGFPCFRLQHCKILMELVGCVPPPQLLSSASYRFRFRRPINTSWAHVSFERGKACSG